MIDVRPQNEWVAIIGGTLLMGVPAILIAAISGTEASPPVAKIGKLLICMIAWFAIIWSLCLIGSRKGMRVNEDKGTVTLWYSFLGLTYTQRTEPLNDFEQVRIFHKEISGFPAAHTVYRISLIGKNGKILQSPELSEFKYANDRAGEIAKCMGTELLRD